ncbi:DUF3140 domain-containing protein [Cereibacter sediminicola]|uniref:DUF3140 domain-containing protein n=1 Tax=Cereibacter sediminicola TaxID=2584941 RepID=UPI0011A41103|nr:DUF3140 domain-containing protein [Cereibacter sediminicola]
MTKSNDEIWDEWQQLVNMTPLELERWLETGESRSVGDSEGGGESTGHRSGRRIVEIKHKRKSELSQEDWSHMGRVVGYIRRHKAQGGPAEDKDHSRWRYSLMNWGHDPLK